MQHFLEAVQFVLDFFGQLIPVPLIHFTFYKLQQFHQAREIWGVVKISTELLQPSDKDLAHSSEKRNTIIIMDQDWLQATSLPTPSRS